MRRIACNDKKEKKEKVSFFYPSPFFPIPILYIFYPPPINIRWNCGSLVLHGLQDLRKRTKLGKKVHDGARARTEIILQVRETFPDDVDQVVDGVRAQGDEFGGNGDQGGGADSSHVVVVVGQTTHHGANDAIQQRGILGEKIGPHGAEILEPQHAAVADLPDGLCEVEIFLHDQPV